VKLIIVLPIYPAVKNAWSLASTPPYVFLASYLLILKQNVVTFTNIRNCLAFIGIFVYEGIF